MTSASHHAERLGTDRIRLQRLLPGPIERVWAYLTEPELRATWLADGAMDLKTGGDVELVFRNSSLTGHADDRPPARYAELAGAVSMHGRITACKPPQLLAYTWAEGDDGCSEVRFQLSAEGDEVRLVVEHSRLGAREALLSVSGGWHTHLDILVDRLAGRTPAPFWQTHDRLEAEYAQRWT